ncbi:pilus assembly protein [Microbacteriaceae bacterium VKM Ac-2854]|nr:pilus assembly protein [Microbacteriaceae bacterium VKM Ac-2854]
MRAGVLADRGSAPAEALLVGALIGVLVLGVLQFALAVYVRNTAIDAAGTGARYGGLVGNSAADARRRTEEVLRAQLGSGFRPEISARSVQLDGRPALAVTVRADLPIIGFLGPAAALDVSGHALIERLR